MIAIAYDVRIYRKCLKDLTREGDIVIEIGPHTGKHIVDYVEKASRIIAIDKSPEAKKAFLELEKKYEKIKFIYGDVRLFQTVIAAMKLVKKCDLLAVDLGGGRYPDTVFKVWALWSGCFKPRDSVIRNRGLAEFLQRAKIVDPSLRRSFKDDGWLSEWGRATPSKLRELLEEFKLWVDL